MLHRLRDTVFDEDRSQLRKGSAPQIMASIRNGRRAHCTPPVTPSSRRQFDGSHASRPGPSRSSRSLPDQPQIPRNDFAHRRGPAHLVVALVAGQGGARWATREWQLPIKTRADRSQSWSSTARAAAECVFYRVLELAAGHDPVRYHDILAARKPRNKPPLQRGAGHPPSLERPAANRPWRTAEMQLQFPLRLPAYPRARYLLFYMLSYAP